MTRRILLFIVLLGLGFLALRLALGSSAFSARRGPATEDVQSGRQRPPPTGGIDVPSKEGDGRLTFSIQGEFEVQPTRAIPLADGTKLLLPKYRLHADDTRPRPEGDNLMELRGVTVELFRLQREGAEPKAVQAGVLTAAMVLVEIERDAHGRPTVHEDREMDFHDAHFRTLPSAGSTLMSLRVARARLRTTDQGAVLRTVEREPFTLRLEGSEPATITGLGLHATMPTGDTVGPVEMRVLAEPRLTSDDGRSTLTARGELLFTEQPDGTARLNLHDDVSASFVQRPGSAPLTARGDHLIAGLRRTREAGKQGALWQWLVLHGAPAQIDAGQARVECERIDVLPSATGSAGLIAATGAPARLTLTPADGAPSVFTSERRICMVPIADSLHEWLGPLGFPRTAFATNFSHMITFAGRSHVEAEQPGGRLTLDASRGLVMLRGDKDGGATSLRGLGDVQAALPGGEATLSGDDGLLLHDAPTKTGRIAWLTLGVGGVAAPRFELRRGDAFTLQGHGRCALRQTTDGAQQTTHIEVTSEGQDAVVRVPEGSLLALHKLDATLVAGAITQLDATGTHCIFEGQTRDGLVRGEATAVHSTDGRTFRLRGAPAHVVRGKQGEVFGDVIDLIRTDDGAGLRAHGNARIAARVARKNGTFQDLDLYGDFAEVLPWRVPPTALRWQARFLPPSARAVFAASWLTPHVHVRGAVRFTLDDPADLAAKNAGDGDELWLALGDNGGRGRLLGQPAHVRVAASGQDALGGAQTISFLLAEEKPLVTLSPSLGHESSMRLATADDQAQGRTKVGVRELTVYCRGDIRIEDRQIRFLGPVRVLGDETAGQAPTLALTADGMVMQRDAKGAVTEIVATGLVTLTSPRVRGEADVLTLDIKKGIAVLSSRTPRGLASITLDNGLFFQNSHLEFDYTTYAVAAWYGSVAPREGQ